MVNFRFHLVSLVAVFLALALGIGMGVTVIDRALVEQLQGRLDDVRNQVDDANARSDALGVEIDRANQFREAVEPYVIDGTLTGSSVTLVVVEGTDQATIDSLREDLQVAGANVNGQLTFTNSSRLDAQDVAANVAETLELSESDSDEIRQTMLARVAAVLAGATPSGELRTLIDDGVLRWDGEQTLEDAEFVDNKLVVASQFSVEAGNEDVSIPLVELLSAQPTRRVVAAEPGSDPGVDSSGEREIFVGPLRSDQEVNNRVSSVDNLESAEGRTAVVLALSDLPEEVGHYGVGPNADALIPPFEQ
jgi:hypothetical protein